MTVHQVGGKYICKHCGKQFLQKIRYNTHMDRHNDIQRHVCQTCGRAFSYKYSLWSHAKKCALNENSSVAAADNEVMLSASSMSAEAEFQALDNHQGSEYVGNLLKIKQSPKYDIQWRRHASKVQKLGGVRKFEGGVVDGVFRPDFEGG